MRIRARFRIKMNDDDDDDDVFILRYDTGRRPAHAGKAI